MKTMEAVLDRAPLARKMIAMAIKKKENLEYDTICKQLADNEAEMKLKQDHANALQLQLASLRREKQEFVESLKTLHELFSEKMLSEDDLKAGIVDLDKAAKEVDDMIAKRSADSESLAVDLGQLFSSIEDLKEKKNIHAPERASLSEICPLIRESDEDNLRRCRPDIRRLFSDCMSLVAFASRNPKETERIRFKSMIIAGTARIADKIPDLNQSEKIMLKRCCGKIGGVTKATMCGCVLALLRSHEEDWHQYVSRAQAGFEALGDSRQETPTESEPDDMATILAAAKSGLTAKLKGKRLGVFGAHEGRNKETLDWIEKSFGLKKLRIYESTECQPLLESIKNGGTDVVIILNGFVGHPECNNVVSCASNSSKRGFPVDLALCGSTSRKMIVMALGEAMRCKVIL